MNTLNDIITEQELILKRLNSTFNTSRSQNSRLRRAIQEIQPYVFKQEVDTEKSDSKGKDQPISEGLLNVLTTNNFRINSLLSNIEEEQNYTVYLLTKLEETLINSDSSIGGSINNN